MRSEASSIHLRTIHSDRMPESRAIDDQRFMALALALGRRGLGNAWPNPAVGAVVVRYEGGEPVIVGRGWTQPGGRPHAETEALRRAGPAARGATLYATLEPCSHQGQTPPCTDAIIAAGISRVVSAMEDPNVRVAGRGHALLRAAGLAVNIGIGGAEARRAHAGHIRRTCEHRPHVTLKLAVSSDGKAGLAGPKPVQITGTAARAKAHLLRAMNDAILVGIGTVLADDPQLTCRLPGMAAQSPVRVVLELAVASAARKRTGTRRTGNPAVDRDWRGRLRSGRKGFDFRGRRDLARAGRRRPIGCDGRASPAGGPWHHPPNGGGRTDGCGRVRRRRYDRRSRHHARPAADRSGRHRRLARPAAFDTDAIVQVSRVGL